MNLNRFFNPPISGSGVVYKDISDLRFQKVGGTAQTMTGDVVYCGAVRLAKEPSVTISKLLKLI